MDSILGMFFLIVLVLNYVKPWFDTPRSLKRYRNQRK